MAVHTNLKDMLDALVDEEGLNTEVTVTLTDQTLIKTAITLVGTIIVGSVAYFTVKGLFNPS